MRTARQPGNCSGMMGIPEVLMLLSLSFCVCAHVLTCETGSHAFLLLPLVQASFRECQVEVCVLLSTKNHTSRCGCSNTVSQLTQQVKGNYATVRLCQMPGTNICFFSLHRNRGNRQLHPLHILRCLCKFPSHASETSYRRIPSDLNSSSEFKTTREF